MRQLTSIATFTGALSLSLGLWSAHAANLTTTVVQAAGANWNGAIWQTNGTGTSVGPPVAGNTYAELSNGTLIAPSANNTRVRNPVSATASTFPGDSLTVATNTEFRFKLDGSLATTLTFPGVGGNPGLIVDGGFLNVGDFAAVTTIAGIVQVPSWAFITLGDNNAGTGTARNATLAAKLTGNGTIALTQTTPNSVLTVSGANNTFSGQWIISSGNLLASGANCLGTNNITVDPGAALALNTLYPGATPLLEFGYDVNSAGTLTLTNGGRLRLHQNCCFVAVVIEGFPLSAGTHFFSELSANFPGNFTADGNGSLTVQPYGTPPPLAPTILTQPSSVAIYSGQTARFTVSATGQGTLGYQWRHNGANLTDGGHVSGARTSALTVSAVANADLGSYDVIVTNQGGPVTSTAATLSFATPTGQAYETAVLTNSPYAYWQLNETGDPLSGTVAALDYAGAFNGLYGVSVQDGSPYYGIKGPQTDDGFPGFGSANTAAQFAHYAGSYITNAPLNLNTNTVTLTAWINPNSPQQALNAILFCRGGDTVAGLRYGNFSDANGNYTLGYAWNNDPGAANWNSQLIPPQNQWSFVALVVAPTYATIYLINTNGLLSATNPFNHTNQAFNAVSTIGWDTVGGGAGGRAYSGTIDEVAVFKRSLSQSEIVNLYSAASGVGYFAPVIGAQPTNETWYAQQTAQFNVVASGTPPVHYQWQAGAIGSGVYTNLTDHGNISGVTTATLTITNLAEANAADYLVVITNAFGAVTSAVATLTVMPVGPALPLTLSSVQPLQTPTLDWNSAGWWSDGNPASVSAISNPGSTYEVLPGGVLRTPAGAADVTFPGDVLTISGDGVLADNTVGPGSTIGELRFKQASPVGIVRFKKLVMNGGQLDATTANNVIIAGEMDVLANTPIYNDTAGDRGCQIDAWLTGSGTIEWHAYTPEVFQPGMVQSLNLTGTSNTFNGKWNVVTGALLGSGLNALGTNDITIGTNGILETLYDVNNTQGNLILNGQMFLHRNDTFHSVTINGTPLYAGTYTFNQLAAAYPSQFPSVWAQLAGSTAGAGSGSLTVLTPPGLNVPLQWQFSGNSLQLNWSQGTLLEATNLSGPWVTNASSSPLTITPTGPQKFYRLRLQ